MKASQSKSILKSSNGFDQTTFASPNRFKSSTTSAFKTPQRASTSNVKKRGPLDSNVDFGSINQDESINKGLL